MIEDTSLDPYIQHFKERNFRRKKKFRELEKCETFKYFNQLSRNGLNQKFRGNFNFRKFHSLTNLMKYAFVNFGRKAKVGKFLLPTQHLCMHIRRQYLNSITKSTLYQSVLNKTVIYVLSPVQKNFKPMKQGLKSLCASSRYGCFSAGIRVLECVWTCLYIQAYK